VVNIISDFREGHLPSPPGMTGYVDALRQVAVDLRKSNTSITRAKSYLGIHTKLREMGVDREQAEQWLDICQEIASSSVSNNAFVKAALGLARLTSGTGMTHDEVISGYNSKFKALKDLEEEIKLKTGELDRISKEKLQAKRELASIVRSTEAAQRNFSRQKGELKLEQDKYLTENKLSWEKIKLVEAVIKSGLKHTGLNDEEIEKLRRQIVTAGSLIKTTKELAEKKNQLQDDIGNLKVYQQHYYNVVVELAREREQLEIALKEKQRAKNILDSELDAERAKLAEVKQAIADRIENLYISRLIIDFLFAPNSISDHDLDRLVSLMVALRQKRLGIGPKQVDDANGRLICQCQLPDITTDFEEHEVDIDHAREVFAYFLSSLVRNKFVSRFEYNLAEARHRLDRKVAVLEGAIEERQRHVI